MIFFTTTTTHIIRRLIYIFLLIFNFSFVSSGQTDLVPGDIMVLQIDEAEVTGIDSFIFVTFVDLTAGTKIYFTDCGVFPGSRKFTEPAVTTNGSGVDEYPSCPEGAVKFEVPTGTTVEAGTIVQYLDGTTDTRFSVHNDALITGTLDFYTKGDQVVVFQQGDGTSFPSEDPDFIFILNADAGLFSLDPNQTNRNHSPYYLTPAPLSPQENELSGTSIPLGLNEPTSDQDPTATALAVGEGTAEIDNVIFNGTGELLWISGTPPAPGPPIIPFTNVLEAKTAILRLRTGSLANDESKGYNWLGESNTGGGDPEDAKYVECAALLNSASSILPVELTSFIGRPKIKTIDLLWVTASETDNDYFAIEKSSNGVDFEEITQVDGRGTTTSLNNYNWTDQSPNDGMNYYRLRQVDYNGDKSYSKIIVIEFQADRSEIQIYPNPTNKELNINLPENWDDETSIVIYDSYGKLIKSFTSSSGSLTVPVDNIPVGYYRLLAMNKSRILNTSFVRSN